MAAPAMPATGLVIDLEYVAALFAREMDRHFAVRVQGVKGSATRKRKRDGAQRHHPRVILLSHSSSKAIGLAAACTLAELEDTWETS
jgi:hypothetical protein